MYFRVLCSLPEIVHPRRLMPGIWMIHGWWLSLVPFHSSFGESLQGWSSWEEGFRAPSPSEVPVETFGTLVLGSSL